jgi:alpha-ketoglutaric semialdehyde dehydrogenase
MASDLLPNLIAGEFRPGTADRGFDDLNPSDREDRIALVPEGDASDVAAAVEAARDAAPAWRRATGPARAEHLHRWAQVIGDRSEELAQALSREVGKPIGEARGEIGRCVVILRYYAAAAVAPRGDVVPAQVEGALQLTLREPLGVVGLITPWNFPAAIPLWKAAPALAFGNTVVVKPAEQSSQVAVLLARTAEAAGIPGGVFNVVLGRGEVVGYALVRHPLVDGVSFTGSIPVGARVRGVCAERNVPCQTEMGGKNVVLVLPDADLDLAARLTAAGAMRYAGQKCTATSRAVVAGEVEEPFLRKVREQVEALGLGPVTDPGSAVGPLISEDARTRVHRAVRKAVEEDGAGLLCGGEAPDEEPFARGFFLRPTVLRDVDPASEVGQEELFGPVLATFTARDLDHALELANGTRYGLSASLFTRDLGAVLEYVDRIEAGLVRVNGDTTGVDPHAPFGGVKASGSGTREQGTAAREFYTRTKTVQVNP